MYDLDHLFTYHPPRPRDIEKYQAIREAGKAFATVMLANTPPSADQADALRKIREAVMTANAAVALGGRIHQPATFTPSLDDGGAEKPSLAAVFTNDRDERCGG